MLDPGRAREQGYFWAIARDDRPWGETDPPAIAFTYAPGRGAVHALKLLDDGYCGVVQCDGYAAYKKLAAQAPDEAVSARVLLGRICADGSTTTPRAEMRRSPAKRSSASPGWAGPTRQALQLGPVTAKLWKMAKLG